MNFSKNQLHKNRKTSSVLFIICALYFLLSSQLAYAALFTPLLESKHNCFSFRELKPGATDVSLKYGNVSTMQQFLKDANLLKRDPNGFFDQETVVALVAFQNNHNIPQTAELNEATWQLMKESVCTYDYKQHIIEEIQKNLPRALEVNLPEKGISATLIDPRGRKIQIDKTGTVLKNSIDNAVVNTEYSFDAQIQSPKYGDYKLIIPSSPVTKGREFALNVIYQEAAVRVEDLIQSESEVKAFDSGKTTVIRFSINNNRDKKESVTFEQCPFAPGSISIVPHFKITDILWRVEKNNKYKKVRIYTKGPSDAHMSFFLDTTKSKMETGFEFTGSNGPSRLYALSCVAKNGEESLLTKYFADDDTDGDQLIDETEQAIGTDIHKVDTDGDGIQDGKEFLVFHTDPTKADSDGNGVNDYQQIANAVNTNTAPKLNADLAVTSKNKPATIDVLSNDTDDEELIADYLEIYRTPKKGTVEIEAGNMIYSPQAGFTGIDTFEYRLYDKYGKAGTASVTVQVNNI